MGDIIELFVVMFIVASVAFAPLGYFIYMFTKKKGEPFGDIEPHGDTPSPLLDVVDSVVGKVLHKTEGSH
jgi:hypothetical protein